jgi:hypothetical protein
MRACPSVGGMPHFAHHLVHIPAGSADDPDATRAAAVLAAYFRLEEIRAFCRQVWHRLALLSVVWILMSAVLPGIRADLAGGLALIAAAGLAAALVECWAAWRLTRALSGTR